MQEVPPAITIGVSPGLSLLLMGRPARSSISRTPVYAISYPREKAITSKSLTGSPDSRA